MGYFEVRTAAEGVKVEVHLDRQDVDLAKQGRYFLSPSAHQRPDATVVQVILMVTDDENVRSADVQ